MNGARRVVVTGLGFVTASGVGRSAFREGLASGRSPVGAVTRFDPSPFRSGIAAEANDFRPGDFLTSQQVRRLDRFAQFSVATTRMALEDACFEPSGVAPDRVAVRMGSALGGIAHAEAQLGRYLTDGVRGVDPRLALAVFGGASSCNVAIEFGFQGPNSTNAMSCASGTIAVGEAFQLIRAGSADAAVAGGVEAPLSPLAFGAFAIIRAMSSRNGEPERACRPFDADRDGFVMGEGAGVLLLEEAERALERGARIYAEIRGFSAGNDAYHMTAPRPDGSQAARTMTDALNDGGLAAGEVDHVNAHASSTPLNDATESLAIRMALGSRADSVAVTGTKPFYGHALGASGAIEAGITAMTISEGWIPPTLNLEQPGEGCSLDYVRGSGRHLPVAVALSNSFGFGGVNAALAFAAFSPPDSR